MKNLRPILWPACALLPLFVLCGAATQTFAQTPGGTSVPSTFTGSYSDGSTTFSTPSNTVTITVSNISGISITPDGGTVANVAPGQTGVSYLFTITNTGNVTDQVRFAASGASLSVVGPGTITAAVIDVDNSSTVNAGDTDIFTNGSAVTSANIAQSGTIQVIVIVSISGAATASQTIYLTAATVTAPAIITGLYFDLDKSGTVTAGDVAITLNETRSPVLPERACVNVLAVIDPQQTPAGTLIELTITAQAEVIGTVNAPASTTGRLLTQVGLGPLLTDPDDKDLLPRKTADKAFVAGTELLTYTITFRNRGDLNGQKVLLRDTLPDTLEYVPGSLRLGNRTLTDAADTDEGHVDGQLISVQGASIALDEVATLSLQARARPALTPGTGIVNRALLTGENLPLTTDARGAFSFMLSPAQLATAATYSGLQVSATPELGVRS